MNKSTTARADVMLLSARRQALNISGTPMNTAKYIKEKLKALHPKSHKVNLYDDFVKDTSIRYYRVKDGKGIDFKIYAFPESIMIDTPLDALVLFSVNSPYVLFGAKKLLTTTEHYKIYTTGDDDHAVKSCIDMLRQELEDLKLQKSERLFVCRNGIHLVLNPERELIPEMDIIARIKANIERDFCPEKDAINIFNIPAALHDLLPFLSEWAIADDRIREEKAQEVPRSELRKLISTVQPKMDVINAYLNSFKGKPLSHEATLIGNLAEFVTELQVNYRL